MGNSCQPSATQLLFSKGCHPHRLSIRSVTSPESNLGAHWLRSSSGVAATEVAGISGGNIFLPPAWLGRTYDAGSVTLQTLLPAAA